MQKNGKNGWMKVLMARMAALLLVSIYGLIVACGSAERKSTNNLGLRGK